MFACGGIPERTHDNCQIKALQAEWQKHVDAIAQIDSTFEQYGNKGAATAGADL